MGGGGGARQGMLSKSKWTIMWHFIRVFTVCKSTRLGVSSLQRVQVTCQEKLSILVHALHEEIISSNVHPLLDIYKVRHS